MCVLQQPRASQHSSRDWPFTGASGTPKDPQTKSERNPHSSQALNSSRLRETVSTQWPEGDNRAQQKASLSPWARESCGPGSAAAGWEGAGFCAGLSLSHGMNSLPVHPSLWGLTLIFPHPASLHLPAHPPLPAPPLVKRLRRSWLAQGRAWLAQG